MGNFNRKDLLNLPYNTNAAIANAGAGLEFSTFSAFPTVGKNGVFYIALNTGYMYRWNIDGTYHLTGGGPYLSLNMPDNSSQRVELTNTHNTFGQASRQIIIGNNIAPIDAGLSFMKAIPVLISENILNNSTRPMLLGATIPDTGSANGIAWGGYDWNSSNRAGYVLYVHSNSGENGGTLENAYTERIWCEEIGGQTCKVVTILAQRSLNTDPTGSRATYFVQDRGTFVLPTTSLLSVENNNIPMFQVQATGNIVAKGARMNTPLVVGNASFTPTLGQLVYIYVGPGANTCNLPDPSIVANDGWEIEIVNMGTGSLTLSRNVYLDAATPTTVIVQGHPNNKLRMRCDATYGARWYAIP